MAQQVILYDLPTKAPAKGWSFNPWRTRMALNFKGIDYKTEFLEYPDVLPTLKALGLPPNDPNDPGYWSDYTCPAIRYADGTFAMDSWIIAKELEKRYPTPSLHLDDPIVAKAREFEILVPLVPLLMPRIPRTLLSPVSAEYFELTRAEKFGKPLEQMEAEADEEEVWAQMKPYAKKLGDLLREKEGPFFLGETFSYADIVFVTCLKFLETLDKPSWQRYLDLDPTFPKLYEACKEWLARDD